MSEGQDNLQEKMARRRRLAVESLLDSSHLRDELSDTQAQQLMTWALARIDRDLGQTAWLTDREADAWLDDWLTAVVNVMKGVNRLTPNLPRLNQQETDYQLEKLLNNLQHLGDTVRLSPARQLLTQSRQRLDRDGAFRRLMHIVTQQDEEE